MTVNLTVNRISAGQAIAIATPILIYSITNNNDANADAGSESFCQAPLGAGCFSIPTSASVAIHFLTVTGLLRAVVDKACAVVAAVAFCYTNNNNKKKALDKIIIVANWLPLSV